MGKGLLRDIFDYGALTCNIGHLSLYFKYNIEETRIMAQANFIDL